MWNAESLSREQIREFLESSEPIEFAGSGRKERYAWVERVLAAQRYGELSKRDRGVVRAYVEKVTGMSASQTTRLIRTFLDRGVVRAAPYQRNRFSAWYTAEDVTLLAEVDRAHERLSGPATRRILQREYEQYGKKEYRRLAKISVGHLYNLRASARYRNQAAVFEATRSTAAAIGERRRPEPQGRPGFLRVDTVHQGDWDGAKGVYHINAVDTVTQWQVVGCASKISEAYLLPVLEAVLAQFPFMVSGFHVDNGSEYINHRVAEMMDKLRAEKSGILNWMIEGCLLWQKEGLGEPEEMRTAITEYREDMDIVSGFLGESCVTEGHTNSKMPSGELYAAFVD